MDEVIADYFGEQVARYQLWSGLEVDVAATEGKRLRECVPEDHRAFVSSIPRTPGFFANLPMIEGSRPALENLTRYAEVYIVSAATEYPNSLREKFDWLAANFPFIDWQHIVLCGDKSIINAEYMIDDNIHHLRRFGGRKDPLRFSSQPAAQRRRSSCRRLGRSAGLFPRARCSSRVMTGWFATVCYPEAFEPDM